MLLSRGVGSRTLALPMRQEWGGAQSSPLSGLEALTGHAFRSISWEVCKAQLLCCLSKGEPLHRASLSPLTDCTSPAVS